MTGRIAALALATLLCYCTPPKTGGFSLPRGSTLSVRTLDEISTKLHHAGDPFEARLSSPIRQGPAILVPLGTRVVGLVKEVRTRSEVRPLQLDLRLKTLYLPDESTVELRTAPLVRDATPQAEDLVNVPKNTSLIFTLEEEVVIIKPPKPGQ